MSHSSTFSALFLLGFLSCSVAFAQKPFVSGYYVGEGTGVSHGGSTYLLLKKYVPTDEQEGKKIKEQGMMTYLDLPLDVGHVTMSGDGFRTVLFSLDDKGKVRWQKELGGSYISSPAGITVDPDGMVYVGERDSSRLIIRKFNPSGKELWQTSVDSLETAHRFFADTNSFLSVLASRTITHQVREGDKMELRTANLYHTLRVNRETGKIESDDYNTQLTNACAGGFAEPQLNEHWVNYTHKDDSLLLYINFRDELLMVAEKELKGLTVLNLTGSAGESFVLARNGEGTYRLFLDRFRPDEKFQNNVDIPVGKAYDNIFMSQNELGGVTLFFCDGSGMEVVKLGKTLNLLWKKVLDLKKLGSDRVVTVVKRGDGTYGVCFLTLDRDGKNRQVRFLSLSAEGEVKK